MTNRPAGLFKRICAAFIDIICVIFILIIGSNICRNSETFKDWFNINKKYEEVNQVVCPSLVENGIGIITSNDGEPLTCKVISINDYFNNHKQDYLNNNPGKTEEEIKEIVTKDYNEKAKIHNKTLEESKVYNENFEYLTNVDNGIFLFFITIGEVIFLFVIPMVNKENKTIGRYLMKLRVITTKDLSITKKHIMLKFAFIYGVETILYSLFLGFESWIIFFPIISLMVILFSPKRQNIHHMLSGTVIVEEGTCVVFSSLEEKEKYDSSLK